jgi:hypothetical protein
VTCRDFATALVSCWVNDARTWVRSPSPNKTPRIESPEQIQRAEQHAASAAKSAPAPVNKGEFLRRLEERRKALALRSRISPSFVPVQVTLEQPFLIWQLPNPQLSIFLGQQIAPFDSFVKINAGTTSVTDKTQFVFYFWWQNDAQTYALTNVNTEFILRGNCAASAAPAVLFGNNAYLYLTGLLTLMEWWNQPSTPIFAQSQDIAALDAWTGPSFDFGPPDVQSVSFDFQAFDLSYSTLLVPPESGVVIEVALQFDYGFNGGELNISEYITADFNTGDQLVMCPFVQLEILTAEFF